MRAPPAHPGDSAGSLHPRRRARAARRGVVLLEILLSLGLFILAAVVVGSALESSVQSAGRMQLDDRANNLLQSTLSALTVGAIPAAETPATNFEPPDDAWTYEIGLEELADTPTVKIVTITVNHVDGDPCTATLTQWMYDPTGGSAGATGETP